MNTIGEMPIRTLILVPLVPEQVKIQAPQRKIHLTSLDFTWLHYRSWSSLPRVRFAHPEKWSGPPPPMVFCALWKVAKSPCGLLCTLNIAHIAQSGTLRTSRCTWGCAWRGVHFTRLHFSLLQNALDQKEYLRVSDKEFNLLWSDIGQKHNSAMFESQRCARLKSHLQFTR